MSYVYLGIGLAVLCCAVLVGLLTRPARRRRRPGPPLETSGAGTAVAEPAAPPVEAAPVAAPADAPEPAARRLVRLRSRLARSQSTLGRGLLGLLSRDNLDDEVWDTVEETLLVADTGVAATREIVDRLRTQVRVVGAGAPGRLEQLLRDELMSAVGDADRRIVVDRPADGPSVVVVVGVNGSGKTTSCAKLARLLVAEGHRVVLGAADTFRAAAAEQLSTWGDRVGVLVVAGQPGADPASIAFEAVQAARQQQADVVIVDTAGRLHTKTGLMDELAKVKRVAGRAGTVTEVLLVLDATTGQNGLTQARVFLDAVSVTGVVLAKLDGTAKGGIVIAVQRELGIPVKLVGIGEGPDDLAPFEPAAFVDGLLRGADDAAA